MITLDDVTACHRWFEGEPLLRWLVPDSTDQRTLITEVAGSMNLWAARQRHKGFELVMSAADRKQIVQWTKDRPAMQRLVTMSWILLALLGWVLGKVLDWLWDNWTSNESA